MKRTGILNAPLASAIARMGHGDLMIVCDAGFPIPSEVERVDLALMEDVPNLKTVLTAIAGSFIAEKVGFADTLPGHNPVLLQTIRDTFPDAEEEMLTHERILSDMARSAKVIVHTGAFDPWGNVLLYSGVDVPRWFSKPGTVAPDYYKDKM